MTTNTDRDTLVSVVAVLVAFPLVMMTIVMPAMVLTGTGHASFGSAGWRLLMPLIPLTVFATLGYLLYTTVSDEGGRQTGTSQTVDSGQRAASELEALRMAYARGELSDSEFETRRNRLTTNGVTEGASTDE